MVNIAGLVLLALLVRWFWLSKPKARAAMAMSSVTVVSNANRLRWFKAE